MQYQEHCFKINGRISGWPVTPCLSDFVNRTLKFQTGYSSLARYYQRKVFPLNGSGSGFKKLNWLKLQQIF